VDKTIGLQVMAVMG